MNLKTAFSALCGFLTVAQAMSTQEGSAAADLEPRQLQQNKNSDNCAVSGEIWCKLNKDGSDCAKINVRKDLCGPETVTMYYKYCNNDDDQIIFDQVETYAELYEGGRISIGHEIPLPAKECRTIEQTGIVNTCFRSRVNADLELEGWKGSVLNFGNYCHEYIHYFPEVKTFTLAPLPTPVLVFSWRLIPSSLICTIRGTNELCQDYLDRLTDPAGCEVDMDFSFRIENTGTACGSINKVSTSVNGDLGTDISVSNLNFCPGNTLTLTDGRDDVSICDLKGLEIPFRVFVDDQSGSFGLDIISFPQGNTLEPADYEIISLKCEVTNGNNVAMSCADYIAVRKQQNLPCRTNVTFKSRIKNTSTSSCIDISDVGISIGGPIGDSTLNINSWSAAKKNFCANENPLQLRKKYNNVNLCWYAGESVDYEVTLNGSPSLTRGRDISFPESNNDTPSPVPPGTTPSPVPPMTTPSPVPPNTDAKCLQKPESITFNFDQRTCEMSSNSQITRTRKIRRRLHHNGGNGKGSNKNKNKQCRACDDRCSFEQLATNPTIYFFEKTHNGRIELHSEVVTPGTPISFSPTEMPDCLEVEIRDAEKRYQTVSFDVTCSANAELFIGDTFGAITIAGLDDC